MSVPIVIYENASFANAWAKAIREVVIDGDELIFGGKIKGKEQYEKKVAKELEVIIKLEGNALREAIAGVLHPLFPTKEKHKEIYISEWDRGYDYKKQGFDYNYENRCEAYQGYRIKQIKTKTTYFSGDIKSDNEFKDVEELIPVSIDQWKLALEDVINQIETGIQSNRNVIVIGNPNIDRFDIPDSPPCLREIWIRWDKKKGVDVKTTWRSRDLFSAWMTNVIGLLSAVTREIIIPLTEKYGTPYKISSYTDHSRSLHIYHWDWESAAEVRKIPVNPQAMYIIE